jgi:hypothetical protein
MVINLIPWNPVYQPDGPFFAAPAEGAVEAFQRILRGSYGLHCTIRQEKGQDISGAAGCRSRERNAHNRSPADALPTCWVVPDRLRFFLLCSAWCHALGRIEWSCGCYVACMVMW